MFVSLIKEINRLISKGMLYIYYWEKLTFQNFDFLGKKIWRNAVALKSKKVQGIFGETLSLALSSSAVFRLQKYVSAFFSLFCSGDKKGFYQISLGNEIDFTGIMNFSPNILAKN